MKEIPILFSTPMMRANLEGRKRMTRRTSGLKRFNQQPDHWTLLGLQRLADGRLQALFQEKAGKQRKLAAPCPYGGAGDLLWGREAWCRGYLSDGHEPLTELRYFYRASEDLQQVEWHDEQRDGPRPSPRWKPSIHMPKKAARLWLRNAGVRVERLWDLTEEDAVAEGFEAHDTYSYIPGEAVLQPERHYSAMDSFSELWGELNGPHSWEHNPWLWVVSYHILSTTGKPQL